MKVLQKICPRCGYLMLFSIRVVSRPGTAADIGPCCPACFLSLAHEAGYPTELDLEEITRKSEPDAITCEPAGD